MINYTYTDAESGGDSYIPPGDYNVQFLEFSFGLSKAGNDKMDVKFRVLDTGSTLSDNIVFTEKAQWKFDTLLKCICPSKGVPLPQKGQQITIDDNFIKTYLLGGTGRVTVSEEEYQNKLRSRITTYLEGETNSTTAHHGATMQPQQPVQQQQQQYAPNPNASPPPPPPPNHQPPPPPMSQAGYNQADNEDDVPF